MSPDINAVKELLKDEKIWNAAKHHMEKYHTSQVSNISDIVFHCVIFEGTVQQKIVPG